MTKSTRLRWHLVAVCALFINAACSLGDGVTTDCLSDDTCNELSACDDGNGFVKPEQGCCELAAERQFGLCAETNVTSDAYETCNSTMDQACCNVLLNEFNTCMNNPTGGGGAGGQAAGSGGQAASGGGGQANQGGQGGA